MHATKTRQHTGRRLAPLGTLLLLAGAAALIGLAPAAAEGDAALRRGIETVTFHALDYRRTSYDFVQRSFVHGAQIDARYRELPGDLHFDGERLSLVEDNEWTGVILDLGRDTVPDNEYSRFYGLSVERRHFHLREFPYQDQTVPFDGIDSEKFFGRLSAPQLSADLALGHTYAVRIAHRTRVGFERVYLFRAVDFTPGVKTTIIWRELPGIGSPLERLPPRTNRGDIRGR